MEPSIASETGRIVLAWRVWFARDVLPWSPARRTTRLPAASNSTRTLRKLSGSNPFVMTVSPSREIRLTLKPTSVSVLPPSNAQMPEPSLTKRTKRYSVVGDPFTSTFRNESSSR